MDGWMDGWIHNFIHVSLSIFIFQPIAPESFKGTMRGALATRRREISNDRGPTPGLHRLNSAGGRRKRMKNKMEIWKVGSLKRVDAKLIQLKDPKSL